MSATATINGLYAGSQRSSYESFPARDGNGTVPGDSKVLIWLHVDDGTVSAILFRASQLDAPTFKEVSRISRESDFGDAVSLVVEVGSKTRAGELVGSGVPVGAST